MTDTTITLEPIDLVLINRIAVMQALRESGKWNQFTPEEGQDWPPLEAQVAPLSVPARQIVHDALGVYFRHLFDLARPYAAHRGLKNFIDRPREEMGYEDIDTFTDNGRYPAFSAPTVGRSASGNAEPKPLRGVVRGPHA